jgi:hypothetical protein
MSRHNIEKLEQYLKFYNSQQNDELKNYFAFRILDTLYSFANQRDNKITDDEFADLFTDSIVTRRIINNARNRLLYEHRLDQTDTEIKGLIQQLTTNLNLQGQSETISNKDLIVQQIDCIKQSVEFLNGENGLLARYQDIDPQHDLYDQLIQKLRSEITSLTTVDSDGFTTVISPGKNKQLNIVDLTDNLSKFITSRTKIIHQNPTQKIQKDFLTNLSSIRNTIRIIDEFRGFEEQKRREAEEPNLLGPIREPQIKEPESPKQPTPTAANHKTKKQQQLGQPDDKKQKRQKDDKTDTENEELLIILNQEKQSIKQKIDQKNAELQKILGVTQESEDKSLETVEKNIKRCRQHNDVTNERLQKYFKQISDMKRELPSLANEEKEGVQFRINLNSEAYKRGLLSSLSNRTIIQDTETLLEEFKENNAKIAELESIINAKQLDVSLSSSQFGIAPTQTPQRKEEQTSPAPEKKFDMNAIMALYVMVHT